MQTLGTGLILAAALWLAGAAPGEAADLSRQNHAACIGEASPLTCVITKSKALANPLETETGGEHPRLLKVRFDAPGAIYDVVYEETGCASSRCSHATECPSGCGPRHPHRVEFLGNYADWFGLTNDVNDEVLRFRVYYGWCCS
jgi:hypothetical protein